jgi:hypothetical protein
MCASLVGVSILAFISYYFNIFYRFSKVQPIHGWPFSAACLVGDMAGSPDPKKAKRGLPPASG